MLLPSQFRGVILWHSVLVSLLGAYQAFAPAPIRLAALSSRQLVLAPWISPDRALVPPQALKIWDLPATISPGDVPYFTPKPDGTIAWDAMNLCIEAGGDDNGDVVSVNGCTGGPDQSWDILPGWRKRAKLLQLRGTHKCIAIDAPKDAPGAHSLTGAMVKLHECDDHGEHDLWDLELIPLPAQGPAQSSTPSPSMRWMAMCAMSIAGLGAWSLIFLLRHSKTQARIVTLRQNGVPLNGSHGGVCLSATTFDTDASRMVPAAMAVDPETEKNYKDAGCGNTEEAGLDTAQRVGFDELNKQGDAVRRYFGEAEDTSVSEQGDTAGTMAKAKQVGLAGLASTATAATVISTAGGVCVGGGCVAAGGVAAGAAGAGGAAAVGTGAAGVFQSIAAAGVAAVIAVASPFSGSSPPTSDALAAMAANSTPLEVAVKNGGPAVLEFYSPGCKYCNEAASSGLGAVEEKAKLDGVNWIMVNTDDVNATEALATRYGVYELPQFEFLTTNGERLGSPVKGGPVDIENIGKRTAILSESLPGGVRRGDRVKSLIDVRDESGTLQKGEIGTVVGKGSSDEAATVLVNFTSRANVPLLPGQFKLEAANDLARFAIFPTNNLT